MLAREFHGVRSAVKVQGRVSYILDGEGLDNVVAYGACPVIEGPAVGGFVDAYLRRAVVAVERDLVGALVGEGGMSSS
jgi:hypothetical protein